MLCEIIQSECVVKGYDCANCDFARGALKKATEEYLNNNFVVIPNYQIIKSTHKEDGTGTIYSSWFQNIIAEVAKGKLKVVDRDL